MVTNLCRFCLETKEKMISLYGTEMDLVTKAKICLNIEIYSEEAHLPGNACQHCVAILDSYFTFYSQCHAADFQLRSACITNKIRKGLPIEDIKSNEKILFAKEIYHAPRESDEEINQNESNHDSFKHICEICMFKCPTQDALKEHQMKHMKNYKDSTVPLTATCEFCGKLFLDKDVLRNHVRYHCFQKENEKYECDFCHKIFSSKPSLKHHLNFHTKTTEFRCEKCPAIYYTNSALALHQRTHEEESCPVCKKILKKYSLKEHMLLHSDYELQCLVCAKPVKNANSLKSHLKLHSEKSLKENITCECGRKFKNNQGYQIHKANNCSKNKNNIQSLNYKCSICKKFFSTKRNLNRHIKSHSLTSYKWKCDTCSKKFNSQSNYKRHLYSHNSTKNIPCKYCKKLFKNFDSLRSHYIQHEGNMIECSHCKKGFATSTLLKYHMQKCHKE